MKYIYHVWYSTVVYVAPPANPPVASVMSGALLSTRVGQPLENNSLIFSQTNVIKNVDHLHTEITLKVSTAVVVTK